MSHLNSHHAGRRLAGRATPWRIGGPRRARRLRAAWAASLCLAPCLAAPAQASTHSVVAGTANASIVASVPGVAALGCSALAPLTGAGAGLSLNCLVSLPLVARVGVEARARGGCLGLAVPADVLDLVRASVHLGEGCR